MIGKRDKTVGVEVNDVSETTVTIEETKLSDNSNNNAAIVVSLWIIQMMWKTLILKQSLNV